MAERNFRELVGAKWTEGKFVSVGLDTRWKSIPEWFRRSTGDDPVWTTVRYNERIVEATSDIVCCYKPNSAFYEAQGINGVTALRQTFEVIRRLAPDAPVIYDAKRGDIGDTLEAYAEAAFEYFGADALTVHPYLGAEALKPVLDRKDKGIFVLCRTSNKGAEEFQDLPVAIDNEEGRFLAEALEIEPKMYGYVAKLYQHVAYRVAKHWNKNGNCALVVGATYPDELREVRGLVDDIPILIPGIGAQGGDVEKTVSAGKDSRGQGMIINSSRGIIFASKGEDFAEAARRETEKLRNLINQYRSDGLPCPNCGSIMVQCGASRKCMNCGQTNGCS